MRSGFRNHRSIPFFVLMLSWVYQGCCQVSLAALEPTDVVTAYIANHCNPCEVFQHHWETSAFDRLNVKWRFHNVSENAAPDDFVGAPSFRVNDGPIIQCDGSDETDIRKIKPYSGPAVYRAIMAQLIAQQRARTTYHRNVPLDADRREVAQNQLPPGQSPELKIHTQPPDPVIDIDWSQIRIVVLASKDTPATSRFLKGPFDRMLGMFSGDQAHIEVIAQEAEPQRFRAVCEAANVEPMPLHMLVMVGKAAEVGFIKGMALKRIEGKLDEKLSELSADSNLGLIVEPVFERTHDRHWRPIMHALSIVEPGRPETIDRPPATAVTAVEDEPQSDSRVHSIVAFIIGCLGFMKTIRAGRGLWQWNREKNREQLLSEIESQSTNNTADPHSSVDSGQLIAP